MGGVNLVAGFRPELWRVGRSPRPARRARGFQRGARGRGRLPMPATQHDAVLWLSGSAYDVVFDTARAAIGRSHGVATVAEETSSWPYQHDRDLTGFIDGTENPTLVEAPGYVLVPEGSAGEGGTVLLLQKWEPRRGCLGGALRPGARARDRPDEARQRRARGQAGRLARREHRPGPLRAHLPPQHGLRHGHEPRDDVRRLRPPSRNPSRTCWTSMVETPDALTRYTHALTGAYYFVPSIEALLAVSG